MLRARVARAEIIYSAIAENASPPTGGLIRVLIIGRRIPSARGSAVKGGARAAVLALLAAVAGTATCAAGPTATAAVRQPAGIALAWGSNDSGQLGDCGAAQSSVPVRPALPAGADVTAVAAGNLFSLALTSDGRVLAWGGDVFGQLGEGVPFDNSVAILVGLPANTRVTTVSAGGSHSLAVAVKSHRHQHPVARGTEVTGQAAAAR
jgi:alpha-tubulin suppressor-like RCC1 family protein